MALRIEKTFGPKMDTLLRMQTAYDIAEARDRKRDIKVQRYVAKPRAGKHPAHSQDRQGLPQRAPQCDARGSHDAGTVAPGLIFS